MAFGIIFAVLITIMMCAVCVCIRSRSVQERRMQQHSATVQHPTPRFSSPNYSPPPRTPMPCTPINASPNRSLNYTNYPNFDRIHSVPPYVRVYHWIVIIIAIVNPEQCVVPVSSTEMMQLFINFKRNRKTYKLLLYKNLIYNFQCLSVSDREPFCKKRSK